MSLKGLLKLKPKFIAFRSRYINQRLEERPIILFLRLSINPSKEYKFCIKLAPSEKKSFSLELQNKVINFSFKQISSVS